jgi:hypothetical protein
MSVAADDDGNAVSFGGSRGDVVQIKPRGVGVDLEQLAILRSGCEYSVEIDVVGFTSSDKPASRMGNDVDMRIF